MRRPLGCRLATDTGFNDDYTIKLPFSKTTGRHEVSRAAIDIAFLSRKRERDRLLHVLTSIAIADSRDDDIASDTIHTFPCYLQFKY